MSFVQRPVAWGHYRVRYTLSKSMNNVGETLFQLADRSDRPLEGLGAVGRRPASSAGGERRGETSVRFDLSGAVQAYSSLPFNILSGVTTIQGTPGAAGRKWRVHRDAMPGSAAMFFTAKHEAQPLVQPAPGRARRGIEAFNLTNRTQCDHPQYEFRSWELILKSAAGVRASDGCWRSEGLQLAIVCDFSSASWFRSLSSRYRSLRASSCRAAPRAHRHSSSARRRPDTARATAAVPGITESLRLLFGSS